MYDKIRSAKDRVHEMNNEIRVACTNIHKLICQRIVTRTIGNESLYDDNLKVRFDAEVLSLRAKFRAELSTLCTEIIHEFMKSTLLLRSIDANYMEYNIGLLTTSGEEIHYDNYNKITIDNYRSITLLDFEVEDFCHMVTSSLMGSLITAVPFWQQHSYTSRGASESVMFECKPNEISTPVNYIDHNRGRINHGSFLTASSSVKLTRAIHILDAIGGTHVSHCDDLISQSGAVTHLVNAATNHVILAEVLKNNTGFGEYTVKLDDTFNPISVEHNRKWG